MIHIYKASAGSGKTYTLAREYIKLVLGYKDESGNYRLNRKGARGSHRAVLAITFTNKATEEMKTRIIHELAVIAGMERGWTKESPYCSELCSTFRCTKEELGAAAAAALRELLYDFNFFSVSTIDSFFQMILRSFAREAEVAGNYELELDDMGVISQSVDKLLQDLNHGEKSRRTNYLINWLSGYMTNLIENGKSFNLFNRSLSVHADLISFITRITNDTYREHEAELLEYLKDEKKFKEFKDKVYSLVKQICRQTSEACRTAVEAIDGSGKREFVNTNIYNALVNWADTGFYKKGYGKTVVKAIDDIGAAYTAKKKKQPTPELDGLIASALDMIKFCDENVSTLRIITENLYQMGLLSTLAEYLDEYRRENSAILLRDTNALISKIIGNEEESFVDAPFLYERVGVWYKHYLIDEFQDTSYSQWNNIRPLIKESLAYDYDNLVIGDEKQCIYRFRNSDPSLLHNLHTEPMAEGRCEIRGNNLRENTNWRSTADVIRFNNTLFSALVRHLGIADIYANVAQQISEKHLDQRGYVCMTFYDSTRVDEWRQQAMETMTRQLRRQLESGYKPGDIAILVRSKPHGKLMIEHLENEMKKDPTFPYFHIVSDSSLILGNSPTISLIVSRLRLISATDFATDARKKTKREVAALINSFESEKSSGKSSSDALIKVLYDNEKASTQTENKNEEKVEDETVGDLVSLVEKIIIDHVPTENLASSSLYINAFQDLVTDFVSRGQGDIRSFLQWWDEEGKQTSVTGAHDENALTILTIHKSKGLEFPCVHVPFAELTDTNKTESKWFRIDEIPGIPNDIIPPLLPLELSSNMTRTPFAEEYAETMRQKLLDNVNILYVAFTRAVNELCIGLPSPKSARNMAADLYKAVEMSTPDFCRSLDPEGKFASDDTCSPYAPLTLDENGSVVLGAPTTAPAKEEAKKTALTPTTLLDLGSYYTNLKRDIWNNTCLEEKYYNIEDARDRGIMLHDTMADVVCANDVALAINNLRHSKKAKELTAADIHEIHSIIKQRVEDPRAEKWFKGYEKIMIERPISIGGDDSRRPDRVVWTADGHIDVIDYKSGSQKPSRYRKQVKEYVTLLSSLTDRKVRGNLYYLDSGDIVEIE